MLSIIRRRPRKVKNKCAVIALARWRANKSRSLANIIWAKAQKENKNV